MSKISKIVIGVILIISLTVIVCVSIFADHEPEIVFSDDPLSFDADASMIGETKTLNNFYDQSITVEYSYTEDYSSTPIAQRNDPYGTYEVYVDDDDSEFYFLAGTDLLCGYLAYFHYEDVPESQAVTESECISIAQSFITDHLQTNVMTLQNMTLSSIEYIEAEGYYDVRYNYYKGQYKTDDELDLWINHEGKVVSFTQLNRGRYINTSINADDYADAEDYLDNILANSSLTDYDVVDTYVTMDDSGDMLLVKVIEYSTGAYSEQEIISHEIG